MFVCFSAFLFLLYSYMHISLNLFVCDRIVYLFLSISLIHPIHFSPIFLSYYLSVCAPACMFVCLSLSLILYIVFSYHFFRSLYYMLAKSKMSSKLPNLLITILFFIITTVRCRLDQYIMLWVGVQLFF